MKLTKKSIIVNEVWCRRCKKAYDVEVRDGVILKNEEQS